MFTGLVQQVGVVASVSRDGAGAVVRISAPLAHDVAGGDSVLVNGVSLTVTGIDEGGFGVSLIPETIERTNLGDASPGRRINLEVDVLAKYLEKLVRSDDDREKPVDD